MSAATQAAEIANLEASLCRRFRVVETTVDVGGEELRLLHPESADALIDERDFEKDERLPYWADLWPSSRILGTEVMAMHGEGRTLLELGCGAGLVTACAARAGFEVTASDYYEDATRFARVNAWRNAKRDVRPLMLDWRDLPESLPRFDLVLASDVLYERPYGALVAAVIDRVLASAGTAIVADPGRIGREPFCAALAANGLTLVSARALPFVDGVIRQTITLLEIVRTK